MSDGRTLRAVWSQWHNSQLSREKEIYMKLQSPKKRDQKETNQKDPKAMKKARHTKEKKRNGKMMEEDPDWTKQSPIEA